MNDEPHREPSPSGGVAVLPARCDDARAVWSLIRAHEDRLIVRSLANVLEHIDRFLVAKAPDGQVVGAIAYGLWPEIGDDRRTAGELQSVCVDPAWRRHGVGRRLVEEQVERLRKLHVNEIVVLTYEVGFFGSLGFREVDKRTMIYKLYTGCINCPKHANPFTCPEHAMVLSVPTA